MLLLNDVFGYKKTDKITPNQKQGDAFVLNKAGQLSALSMLLRRHGAEKLIRTYEDKDDNICKEFEVEGRKLTFKTNRYSGGATRVVLD